MVSVLAVADEVVDGLTLARDRRLRPDVILGAGDLPFDYLESLATLYDAPCVYVPGNHDPDLHGYRRGRTGWTRAGLPADDPGPLGAINADGRTVTVAGLRIAGLGGCLRYSRGPNQYTERRQRLRAARLLRAARWHRRREVDVFLTHSPALGVGDAEDPAHRGFESHHRIVGALRPTLLVHGHVHPYGTRPMDLPIGEATTSMNVVGFCWFEIDPRTRRFEVVKRRHGA